MLVEEGGEGGEGQLERGELPHAVGQRKVVDRAQRHRGLCGGEPWKEEGRGRRS